MTQTSTRPPTPASAPGAGAGKATGSAMKPARPPVGTGFSPLVAQLIALAIIALGVVAIRDALVSGGLIGGATWTSRALARLDGLDAAGWMVPVLGLIGLIGVLLLLVVFKRRPRKTLTLNAKTGVYLRTGDLTRIVTGLVEDVDGVTHVDASATRRKLKLTVRTVAGKEHNSTLTQQVQHRLAPALDAVHSAPSTKITVRNEELT